MDRKQFLATTFSAGLGLAVMPGLLSCAATTRAVYEPFVPAAGDLKKVRGNISRFTNRGGTVGLLETKDGFVVIDSQFPDVIQPLLDGISSKGKPVLYLCNTHHHGDHTSGNIAFQDPNTKIVAHQRVPELQRLAAEKSNKLSEQRYPTVLFDKEHLIKAGNERITAYHFGNGHTYGDVMYHFENDNVVHMGDLMFINLIPVYRTADGSDSRSWIRVLEKAQTVFDNDTMFVFGHANTPELTTGRKADLAEMARFLEASNQYVQKAISENKSTDELLKQSTHIPGFANRITPDRYRAFLDGIRQTLAG